MPIFIAALLVLVGIFAAVSNQSPTGAVPSHLNITINASCVETSKVAIKGITNDDFCCRLIQRSSGCTFIGGVMDIPYNYDKKTGLYDNYFSATHICPDLPKAGGSGIYANYEIISTCQNSGYTVVLS